MLIVFSYATLPKVLWRPDVSPSVQSVWYFGWLTALSTGIGPLPFFFMDKPSQILLGAANAVAAGMMMSASVGLSVQGCRSGPGGGFTIEAAVRTFIGALSGWFFIRIAKKCLEKRDEAMSFADIRSFSVRKVLLVVFVMTLHSFSEGVGIGVSFAGDSGSAMGLFISVSLAVHNVPEGLAVALVMVPGGASTVDTVPAIFTSLPQPIMAVPAFLFVETFEPFRPWAWLAAGAMLFVAVFELFPDALKSSSALPRHDISFDLWGSSSGLSTTEYISPRARGSRHIKTSGVQFRSQAPLRGFGFSPGCVWRCVCVSRSVRRRTLDERLERGEHHFPFLSRFPSAFGTALTLGAG